MISAAEAKSILFLLSALGIAASAVLLVLLLGWLEESRQHDEHGDPE